MKQTTTKDIFQLFLLILFPIHTWSIYLVFYNFEWVAKRTVLWDAVGYSAYSLAWALLESLIISLLAIPIFLLLRKSQGVESGKAILGTVFLTLVIWMILFQIDRKHDHFIQSSIIHIVEQYNLRYRYLIGLFLLAAGMIALSIIAPPFLVKRSEKSISFLLDLFRRVELLSYFFLFMDIIAIAIVIIRNLPIFQA